MTNLERQKALYEYLLKKGDNYTNQFDIAKEMYLNGYSNEYYDPTIYNSDDFHNSTLRTKLTDTIRAINENPDFEKIIISNGNGIKIATEEDYDKMIKSLYRAVFAKLKRIREIEKKAKRNGQITIDKKEIISFLENDND